MERGLAVWARSHSRQARVTHGRPPTAPVSGGGLPAVVKAQTWLNHVCTLPGRHGLQSARLCRPWILQARILERVASSLLQGNLPDPGTEPASPALQAGEFTVWASREARNHRSQRETAVLSEGASPAGRPRGEELHFQPRGKVEPSLSSPDPGWRHPRNQLSGRRECLSSGATGPERQRLRPSPGTAHALSPAGRAREAKGALA